MTIVLGYDESPGARRALEVAIDLASQYAEPLLLVYGVTPPGGVGEEFKAHQAALEELGRSATDHALSAAAAAGVQATTELVHGKPAEALLEVAARTDARMIVLGTWGDSPLHGAIVGSTPHRLLHMSDRPVVVVPE